MKTLQSVLNFVKQKALVVVFSVLCTLAFMKGCVHPVPNVGQKPMDLKPTTEYVKDGVVHTVIKVRELTPKEMKVITDSLRKTVKGKPQIREVIEFVSVTDTVWRNLPAIINGDTVTVEKIDSYVTAKATINTRLKEGTIELSLRDTLNQKRTFKNRFLRANTQTVDMTNKNSYVKIVAGSAIVLKEPKPVITFGPTVSINPITGKVQWGIGATFNVLSIKTRK